MRYRSSGKFDMLFERKPDNLWDTKQKNNPKCFLVHSDRPIYILDWYCVNAPFNLQIITENEWEFKLHILSNDSTS